MTSPARLPHPVGPGSRIGVAALSGPVDPVRLEAGVEVLRSLGFEPVLATNLLDRYHLFAGTDDDRLSGFHALMRDPTVEGVVFARGGHGVLRVLPRIDWDLIARRRLPLVGYSDLTPFLNHVVERCSLVSFHGPMVATDLGHDPLSSELDCLAEMLEGRVERDFEIHSVQGASSGGTLRGGCLTMLTATAGTPFFTSFADSILMLEDIGEPIYRWDRMLTHLHLSGSLDDARGLVFGHCDSGEAQGLDSDSWNAWLCRVSSELGLPVADQLLCGHGRPNLTLPLGAFAHLDLASSKLSTLLPSRSDSQAALS